MSEQIPCLISLHKEGKLVTVLWTRSSSLASRNHTPQRAKMEYRLHLKICVRRVATRSYAKTDVKIQIKKKKKKNKKKKNTMTE